MLSARMNEGGGSVHPAPTKGDCAKTQLDYIAEDVIKRFFSLDNSRALGVQTWFLPLLQFGFKFPFPSYQLQWIQTV